MSHHFGVLIPSTNTTVEIEYSRLLPPTLQAHVGRLKSSGTGPFAPSLDADVDYPKSGSWRPQFQNNLLIRL
jgi:maleate isomerase